MPIENDKVLTKVRGVSGRETQRALKYLKKTNNDFEIEITGDLGVIIHSDSLSEPIEAGILKEEYLEFIEALHNPVIETKITGGTYRVYDENNELVKEVSNLNDLPLYEQGLIHENYWSFERNNNGLNLIMYEKYNDNN